MSEPDENPDAPSGSGDTTEFESPSDFHSAMQRLKEVADKLDSGELPLEEAMECYEEGLFLINFCERRLEDAELLIEQVDDSDSSQPRIEPKEPPES